MVYAVAAATIAVAVLILLLMRRGSADRRGDLLGPPPSAAKGRPSPPPPTAPPVREWPEGAAPIGDLADRVAAEARQLLAQDRKIEAIKLVRAATRWDLRTAKEFVERL